MKKIFVIIAMILFVMCPSVGMSAERSSDKMILEWTTNKVWVNNGELCVTGTFVNKRNDLTITKLNDFVLVLNYERADGTPAQFVGKPQKLPICKVMPLKSRKLNFNFGKFNDEVKNWVTTQNYVFTYINGARW
mgnify:CR=1 FL=1